MHLAFLLDPGILFVPMPLKTTVCSTSRAVGVELARSNQERRLWVAYVREDPTEVPDAVNQLSLTATRDERSFNN